MAELDAGLTLDLLDKSGSSVPDTDATDTTDFEAELGLVTKKNEEKPAIKASQPAATAPALQEQEKPAIKSA